MNFTLARTADAGTKIKFRVFLFPLLFISLFSCDKPLEPVDNSGPYASMAIYRTKQDYFHKVSINIDGDTAVARMPYIPEEEAKLHTYQSISGYIFRVPLDSGYVLGGAINEKDYFTDLSIIGFQEFYNGEYYQAGYDGFPLLMSHVIDKDPFTEFYLISGDEIYGNIDPDKYSGLDIVERSFRELLESTKGINEIIKNGQLEETYFRVK